MLSSHKTTIYSKGAGVDVEYCTVRDKMLCGQPRLYNILVLCIALQFHIGP